MLTLGFCLRSRAFSTASRSASCWLPPDGAGIVATFNPFQVELSTEPKGGMQPADRRHQLVVDREMRGYPTVPASTPRSWRR